MPAASAVATAATGADAVRPRAAAVTILAGGLTGSTCATVSTATADSSAAAAAADTANDRVVCDGGEVCRGAAVMEVETEGSSTAVSTFGTLAAAAGASTATARGREVYGAVAARHPVGAGGATLYEAGVRSSATTATAGLSRGAFLAAGRSPQ